MVWRIKGEQQSVQTTVFLDSGRFLVLYPTSGEHRIYAVQLSVMQEITGLDLYQED